jgi:hypothetical protein
VILYFYGFRKLALNFRTITGIDQGYITITGIDQGYITITGIDQGYIAITGIDQGYITITGIDQGYITVLFFLYTHTCTTKRYCKGNPYFTQAMLVTHLTS